MHDQLFQHVYAWPELDEPRQVLADALDEVGDPRGAFISLQLARHQGRDTRKSRGREKALRYAHGLALHGALAPHVSAKATRFERGFPWDVTVVAPPPAHGALDAWNTIGALSATGVHCAFLATAPLRALRRLEARAEPLLDRVTAFERLERLELAWGLSGPEALVRVLARAPTLRQLVLWAGETEGEVWPRVDVVPPRVELFVSAVTSSVGRLLRTAQGHRPLTLQLSSVAGEKVELVVDGPSLTVRAAEPTRADALLESLQEPARAGGLRLAPKIEALSTVRPQEGRLASSR